jgi:peptidoglycan/xylan/chitin deacetylase (PgdA/CDA1 family)
MKRIFLKALDATGTFSLFNPFTRNSATVFMMHAVIPVHESRDAISTDLLEIYFSYLKRHKYKVLSLQQYVSALENHEKIYKAVVFTVDDGYRDFYQHAYPVFKKYGYSATVFLTSDFIEGKLFLWWNQIEYVIQKTRKTEVEADWMGLGTLFLRTAQEKAHAIELITSECKKVSDVLLRQYVARLVEQMEVDISGQPRDEYAPLRWPEILEMQENGIDFHPHSKTHPILTRISPEECGKELRESKECLEQRLGREANILCYPDGGADDFSESVITCAKETGYRAAVTGLVGYDNTLKNTDLFQIHRLGLPPSPLYFKEYVSGLEAFKFRLRRAT